MAIDIVNSISGEPIQHGAITMLEGGPGDNFFVGSGDIVNTPLIADIQSKYDDRFDDVDYYG